MAEAPPGDMAIITVNSNSFRRNVLPILRDLIGLDAVYKSGLSVVELWGRQIYLIGCQDTRSEGKLRGCTLRAALVDEACLIPESSWMVLLQRTAMNNGRIFATTNPDSSMHWLKKGFIDNNQDVTTYYFTLHDNPVLKEEEKEFLERQHSGVYYRRFIAGEWCMAEGAVFEFFDEKIHTIRKPPSYGKYYIVGVDVGFTNPTGFVLIGYNDLTNPPLWVEKEYYWNSKATGRQKTDAEFAHDLKEFCFGHNVKAIYVDPAAASFKVEIRKSGIQGIPIKDAKNDVEEGIKTLSSFMHMGDLKVVSHCRNLIGEIQGYCWDSKAAERGFDEPIKRDDHCFCGGTLVLTEHGYSPIESISPGTKVKTRSGWNAVYRLFENDSETFSYTVMGKTICSTASHKFMTWDGWKEISSLKQSDILFVETGDPECLKCESSTELNIDVIQTLKISVTEDISERISQSALKDMDISIETYGNSIMETFHPDTIFITKTKISPTIALAISNVSQLLITFPYMEKIVRNLKESGLIKTWITSRENRENGAKPQKEKSGTEIMDSSAGELNPNENMNAVIVKSSLVQKHITPNFVQINVSLPGEGNLKLIMNLESAFFAKPLSTSINIAEQNTAPSLVERKSLGRKKVYNLHVDNEHEYFVEGILVKNCIDAMRYALYSHFGSRTNLDYHEPKDDFGRGLGHDDNFHPYLF